MEKCVIVYNPASGKKIFKHKVDYVTKRLNDEGYMVEVHSTKAPKHAVQLVEKICEKPIDLLIISGGDGTFHECLNGYNKAKYKPKIGYIPSGTTCDIGKTLKIPKDIDLALDIIFNHTLVEMDYVNTNEGSFIYVSAIGTYVDIPYVTESKLKKKIGYLAYFLTGIKEFFTIPIIKAQIEHDEGITKGRFSLILIVNSKHVAGFNIVKRPILDDGKVDVVLYRYIPFFNNIIYFISFILGPKVLPGVKKIRTKRLDIYTDKEYIWNMDGEKAHAGNLNLMTQKQRMRIYVNNKIKNKYFKEQ